MHCKIVQMFCYAAIDVIYLKFRSVRRAENIGDISYWHLIDTGFIANTGCHKY